MCVLIEQDDGAILETREIKSVPPAADTLAEVATAARDAFPEYFAGSTNHEIIVDILAAVRRCNNIHPLTAERRLT